MYKLFYLPQLPSDVRIPKINTNNVFYYFVIK